MQPGPGSRSLVRCHNGRVEVLLCRCEVKIAVSSAVESVGFGSGGLTNIRHPEALSAVGISS